MTTDEKHLWNRGGDSRQNWYLRFPVPRPIRKLWPLSKTGMIIQPLGTDSLTIAQRKRDELVPAYRRVFARLEAGEQLTAEQIAAAANIDVDFSPRTASVLRAIGEHIGIGGEAWVAYLREKAIADGMPLEQLDGITAFRQVPLDVPEPAKGETVSEALEHWLTEKQSDEHTVIRADTINGHRGRVKAFTEKYGDLPLAQITRAMASDFLAGLKCKNQTRNQYAMTLKAIVEHARKSGRLQQRSEDNPFADQRREFSRMERDRYTDQEAVTLISAFGPRLVKPAKHTVETALPWAVLIAAHSGLGREEVSQLTVADIKTVGGNGSTVTVLDVHDGDDGHHLKNDETRPRQIPVHKILVRAGFLDYVAALPKNGPLFPGLKRRANGEIGELLGKRFNERRCELGITRDGMLLDFHSWRDTVATKMDEAGIPESHMNEVLGHAQKTETTRTYSKGPGIHNLKVAVDSIEYEGLQIKGAKK
jgi:integrase